MRGVIVPRTEAIGDGVPGVAPASARPAPTALLAMALLSAAGLCWEIALTRLASVLLSYHFAFVAVSLAISGLGVGAALVYALPERRARVSAVPGALAAAPAFILAALLAQPVAASGSIVALIALALLPFVAIGVAAAALFRVYAGAASWLYGADLLGAGLGALAAVLGLDTIGPFGLLFALGAVAALAAWLLVPRRGLRPVEERRRGRGQGVLAAALLVVTIGGLVVQAVAAPLGIDYAALRNASPDKTIVPILRDTTQQARIIDTRWDAYARTDVVATSDPTQRAVFTDGGAGTYMLRWNGNPSTQQQHLSDLETLPFLLGPHANVLVIGAGGGIDVVRALVAGARHVTAVELNGATVDAVRAERAYDGNVLDRPGVTTVVDDGRHFLARTHEKYDVILLNLVYSGAAEGTSHALDENYIFTTEAFQGYLAHLTAQGRIGIISHQALEGLRAFTTGLQALHNGGLSYKDALARSTLLMTNNDTPEQRPTLTVIARDPLNGPAVRLLRTRGNGDLNLQPLWVPYLYTGSFDQMAAGHQTLSQFLQGEDYAVDPTSDDHPFFFDLNEGLPEGLSAALWYSGLLAAGVIALVIFLRERPDVAELRAAGATTRLRGGVWALGFYVALLGAGFMCVEVPIIQRFILILGEPVLALTVVLATLLIAGGVGSLIGARLFARQGSAPLAPLVVVALVLLALVAFPALQPGVLALGRAGQIAASVAMLVPLGLALGLPFPLGLRLAARSLPGDVALFWSLNALFAVLGSVLAEVIAVQVGFGAVMLVGVTCYALAAVTLSVAVTRTRPLGAAVARGVGPDFATTGQPVH